MRKRQTFCLALYPVLLLLGLFGDGTVQAGSITYSISVNTSSLFNNGISGGLDLVFNAATLSSQLANASVTNFQTDGTLALTSSTDGDASGTLPGTLSLDNGVNANPPSGFNDVFQGITYGTSLSFDVTLSGPAVDTPNSNGSGSSFFLYLYDNNGITQLTTDTQYNGAVAVLNLNSDGTTTPLTFPATPSGSPAASVTPTPATSAVPEPSSLVLVLTALPASLLGLAGTWRRRKNGERPASAGW